MFIFYFARFHCTILTKFLTFSSFLMCIYFDKNSVLLLRKFKYLFFYFFRSWSVSRSQELPHWSPNQTSNSMFLFHWQTLIHFYQNIICSVIYKLLFRDDLSLYTYLAILNTAFFRQEKDLTSQKKKQRIWRLKLKRFVKYWNIFV